MGEDSPQPPYSRPYCAHRYFPRGESTGVRAVLTGADVREYSMGGATATSPCWRRSCPVARVSVMAAVAADTLEEAEAALELIDVVYQELPAVLDPVAALQEGSPIIHPDVNSYLDCPSL